MHKLYIYYFYHIPFLLQYTKVLIEIKVRNKN